ncbi:MAG: DUF501 domain-containing protein [Planctomycetes bacterium]|nr:DUF501 domain-containing protein [Planctomycetota bacterium]
MTAERLPPDDARADAPDHDHRDDVATVRAQLGRPARGRWQVASRCRLGLPVLLEAHPVLDDGAPFPTLYWLTCPLARRRVSRLEQQGGVRAWTERLERDPDLRAAFERAQADYAAARAARLPAGSPAHARLRGGVGGSEGGGVKCLHAHYAHARAGGDNPVGRDVAAQVEPLDCATPCVVAGQRSPGWREPCKE